MSVLEEATLSEGSRTLTLMPASGIGVAELDFGFPSPRTVVRDSPGRSGADDETSFHGPRTVSLSASAVTDGGKSPAEWMDDLSWFLHPNRRPVLEFKREGQSKRRVTLRADALSAPLSAQLPNLVRITASWLAPSGREESADESMTTANPEGGESGRTYDLTFDRVYPASTGLGTIVVTNAGNADADPTLRIFGPCTDPQVTNETTGDTLKFAGITVADGDWLEVDMAEATVLLNGDASASRFSFVDFPGSTFWTLGPGDSTVRFHPASSSGASVLEITFRSQWI